MSNSFWNEQDFAVFTINGLESRMNALQTTIQPKFQIIGDQMSNQLSSWGYGEFYTHVAKHARRTVNPPSDSWVASAPSKRGYKALTHFQVGLWRTHVFIVLAVIYENPSKPIIADKLLQRTSLLTTLPKDYVLSGDHMKPDLFPISKERVNHFLTRLQSVKKAELLIGRSLSYEYASQLSKKEFQNFVQTTLTTLQPIYQQIAIN